MAASDPRGRDAGDPHDADRERLARSAGLHPEVTDPRVRDAMRAVPREAFVPREQRSRAFDDAAIPIGHGQTISAPHMVAIMCSVLGLRPGQRVLEVGTGSGYHAAVMQHLVRPDGRVFSVEMIGALVEAARSNLAAAGYPEVEVFHGDGALGRPERAPFDRISVAAACPEVPAPLLSQLTVGGRMVLPVGRAECVLVAVDRTETGYRRSDHGLCLFVPLVGPYGTGRP